MMQPVPTAGVNGAARTRTRGGLLGTPAAAAEEGSRKREVLTFIALAAAALLVLFLIFLGYRLLSGGG